MRTFCGKLRQTGISLLEVLLALAIISIIYVMSMQYFTTASSQEKLNIVRTFIGADMAAVQSYGINNPTYPDLTWKTLVENGYLNDDPKNIDCSSGCVQKTPWGDDVSIGVDGGTGTSSPKTPYIQIPFPDSTYCKNLQDSYGANMVDCKDTTKAKVFMSPQ